MNNCKLPKGRWKEFGWWKRYLRKKWNRDQIKDYNNSIKDE